MVGQQASHSTELVKEDGKWGGAGAVMQNPDELRVIYAALDSFYEYSKVAHYNTTHLRRQSFYALPQAHWQLLAAPPFSYLDTLNAVDDAIDSNAELAAAILRSGLDSFDLFPPQEGHDVPAWRNTATASDIEKARSTLRQLFRDWSAEGAPERYVSISPIIAVIDAERLHRVSPTLNVLVPGAGLGRLVFELCKRGFIVEGNDISYHQLLASSYILNKCPAAQAHTLYPWIHGFSNHASRAHHLQAVRVPDVHPALELQSADPHPGEMSMSASDFLPLYGDDAHREVFDAVATVFFLDTAPNPIRYIETIRHCLKPGGIWTNLGPLLWHFENNPPGAAGAGGRQNDTSMGIADPGNVELTDDEVVALVEKFGFRIEKREGPQATRGKESGYIQDPQSMLQSLYRVSHWVARRI